MAKININDNSVQGGTQKERILDYLMEGHSRTDRVKDPRTGKYYASYSLV